MRKCSNLPEAKLTRGIFVGVDSLSKEIVVENHGELLSRFCCQSLVWPHEPTVTVVIVLLLLASWTWLECWSKNLVQHRWAKSVCHYGSTFRDGYFTACNSCYRPVYFTELHSKIGMAIFSQLCAVLLFLGCQEPWVNNVMWGSNAEWSSFCSFFSCLLFQPRSRQFQNKFLCWWLFRFRVWRD